MSGETNKLIGLAKNFNESPNKENLMLFVSTGEKVSSSLLAIALDSIGVKAKSLSASQISMKTTSSFSKVRILDMDSSKILQTIEEGYIPIITGFQGITEEGDVTTLGRGGSDTAVAMLQIYQPKDAIFIQM